MTTTTAGGSRRSGRRIAAAGLVGLLALAGVGVVALALVAGGREPSPLHPFFAEPLRNYAHRGGGRNAPESTLAAFATAVENGVEVLEMDVRLTADRELVVLHDDTVDRTTDGSGAVSGMTLSQVRRLNAGHHFRDAAGDYPYRRAPERVPTFREVMEAHRELPFVVELKAEGTAEPLCRALREGRREVRTLVGSFARPELDRFRRACPGTPTSASFSEAVAFIVLERLGLEGLYRTGEGGLGDAPRGPDALLVSERNGPLTVVTPSFLAAARRLGLPVVVWTVNDPGDMRRLLDLGVDGLLTDDPKALDGVLAERR